MNKFLIKLFALSLVFVGLCYGVDYLIERGIKTSSYREISKWNEVIEGGIDADRLIVGSSRALVHFDPRIIEEKTGQTCYNLGIDGSKYPAQREMVELYHQKNRKPKVIEWSLDFASFETVEGIYRYEQFIPFWDEPKIKELLALNKNMDLAYLNIPIARFSNDWAIKYRGIMELTRFNRLHPLLINGYREKDLTWNVPDTYIEDLKAKVSSEFNLGMYADFIEFNEFLLEQDIEVRWIITPYYEPTEILMSNMPKVTQALESDAIRLNIQFLDYSYKELSENQYLFYNGIHLNKKGVSELMNKLYK